MSLRADAPQNRHNSEQARWRDVSARLSADPADGDLRLIILAAHPDDETIGASLLLSRHRESFVAFLTDGAPRDRKLWSPAVKNSREEYASIRRAEAAKALSIPGVPERNIHWLGAVDQEAVLEIGRLTRAFAELLALVTPSVVIAHAYEGGHPDHDSAAVVARLAISVLEERQRPSCPSISMIVTESASAG
jgi:LmbE family N-acetylglucosaminyl deacetylase